MQSIYRGAHFALTLSALTLIGCGGSGDGSTGTYTGAATGDATGAATGNTGTNTGATTGGTTGAATGTTNPYPIDVQVLSFEDQCEADPGTMDLLTITGVSEAIDIAHRGIVADVCATWGVTATITEAQLIEVTYEDTGSQCKDACWWYLDYRLHDVPAGTYTIVIDGIEDTIVVLP